MRLEFADGILASIGTGVLETINASKSIRLDFPNIGKYDT